MFTARLDTVDVSRPTWARGLKLLLCHSQYLVYPSRPTWARGLKLSPSERLVAEEYVAPHVGAWIETNDRSNLLAILCRAPRGRVD